MPDRWGKALDEAGAGETVEKRHWWLWVEDGLIALGTVVLLVAAILHWRGVKILALPFASVLYADLAVMAVLFVLRVRRFVRVHYLERGRGAPKG